MTERSRGDIDIAPDRFAIGASRVQWDGAVLDIEVDERTMPPLGRIRGRIRVQPQALIDHEVALDPAGRHRWRPYAPQARVEVALASPKLSWSGRGYFDSNSGDEPLERGFRSWNWSRLGQGDETLVLYDAQRRDGSRFELACLFSADGAIRDVKSPPEVQLPRGMWGVARPTRGEAPPKLLRKLEDAPFYTRSEIETTWRGQTMQGVHESLDLDRFSLPVVQAMLPFRMPRIARMIARK